MVLGVHIHLVVTAALLSLTQTGIQSRAENDILSVTLPEWRENSEYITQCFWDRDSNRFCDWTKTQRRTGEQGLSPEEGIDILESSALGLQGDACLEFWYLAPSAAIGSELQVLLKSSAGLVEIWSSPSVTGDAWEQVFVPLYITEQTQVVFQAVRLTYMERQVISNKIGIRRGTCGHQCDSDTEIWTDESTRCLCSSGQLSCSTSQCPEGQLCGSQTRSSSGIHTSGTCTVHSDTGCSSFDGVLFRFTAPCTYVLAKSCSPTEPMATFSVEVVNEHKENSSVTVVQQVIVDLKTIARVSLLKRQTHRVVVNGIWRNLPLILKGGAVRITGNRAAVVLKTRFGLSVSFDNAGAVHVSLPATYSDKICGLCGNFNHFRDDDYLKPDGTYAQDATALAESWQTGEATSSCEVILVPHQCDPVEMATYASELFCGGLFSHTGPFSACQSVLGAESYFRACVAGMCSTHGDPAVLCETLQAYSDICQVAGVFVPTWRNSTFCTQQCGENSHYDSCANGCPETCSGQDVARPCGRCEERCECDTGFKFRGRKCVPLDECGCWKNGKHYDKGDVFFEGECTQQCQCMGNNEVQCSIMRCEEAEVCKVKDGVRGCFPFKSATCSVYGDPHYITFDGRAYDFQGGCSYILTTTCTEHSKVQFTVTGQNLHPPLQGFTRSKLEDVTLQVDDLRVTLSQSGEVYVHNISVKLPYSTNGTYGSLKVYKNNYYIILETTFGLRMMIDGQNRLFLQVDESYMYELCGLCGTYSDNQGDDFVTPDGQNVTDTFEFGDSWRVKGNYDCVVQPNNPRLCDYDEENEAFENCFSLFGDGFKACHEPIHPETHLHSCVYDYCATAGDPHTLCESLKSYAAACMVAGVDLPHWENDTACGCPLNCNFDDNLCGWEQLIQDSFDWIRYSGPTPSEATGPNQDHTTGAGFYLYMEGDGVSHGDSARLLSLPCHMSGPLCLQFWYHMSGSATAMALNMYLLKHNNATKIWSKKNNQGSEWLQAKVDIGVSGPFQVIVEGIRGSNTKSDVAIDDISIQFGLCSRRVPGLVSGTEHRLKTAEFLPGNSVCDVDCSFDRNLCSWSQMITDAFDWTWWNGSTPTLMTGPSADHTGGGHYLYIEASHVTHGDTARLISSECSVSGPQCLQFWYHMYGSADTMGLHVYLLQDKKAKVIWWKRNDQRNKWHQAQVEFTTAGPFQIIVEGRRGSNDESDVAIDDVKLYHGQCSVCALSCNFDNDLCGWEQLIQDSFDWTRHSGPTPTNGTGPNQDHTTGAGSYMYIEGDSVTHGDSARLLSTQCHNSGPLCLQFWYHMRGSATAMALNIYLLINNTATKIWSKRNNQGPEWLQANVDIEVSGPFQVIFEAIRGSNPQSDVAIDDVLIHFGYCSGRFSGMVSGSELSPTTSDILPSQQVCDVDCSFDRNLCRWSQMITDAFDWTWWNGSTPTLMTGPSADHTGGGHYLYIEASHVTHGDTARLISSECSVSGPQCLQFWYHMYGSADTMGLHVYLLQDKKAKVIWWKRNDQRNKWHQAQVEFTTAGPFQIIVEGRRGSNDESDVAIDDVKLYHGQCSVCALSCNFDNDLCGWEQLIQDSFDWTRHSGPTPTNGTGPNQDHTTGAGSYMYIEGNSVTHGDSARLLSTQCHNSGPLCLQFWYHMRGSATAMALNIYLLINNTATKIWSTRNNQGPEWLQANVDIEVSGPFQVIFEAIRGSNPQSDVAIDDVSIHFGYCSGRFSGVVSGSELAHTSEVLPSQQVCDVDCSFDRNLCSWSQMLTDAFDWTWWNGSTPTLMTGPSADHTGGGHYLYVEASHVTYGDTARLISSECSNSGPQCLQFWYHMYGSADTMGLHVYLLQNKVANAIWRRTNDQGNMWHLAQVDFTTTGSFQIIFEGRRGSNHQSDVAIDDVSLHNRHCRESVKTTPASTTLHPYTTEGHEITPGNSSVSAQPLTSTASIQTTSKTMSTTIVTAITPTTSHFTTQTTTKAAATTETSRTSSPDELTSANPVAPTTQPQLPSTTRPMPPTDHSQTTARPQPPTMSHFTTQTTTEAAATTETSHTSSPDELTSANPVVPTTQPQLPSTTRPMPPTDHSQTTARPQPSTMSHFTTQTTTKAAATTETSRTSSPDELTSANPVAPTTQPQLPSTTRPMPPTDHSQTTARPQPPTMSHFTTQTTTEAAATTETSHTSSPDELTSPNPAASTTRPQLPSTTRPMPPTDHSQTTARPQPPTMSHFTTQTTTEAAATTETSHTSSPDELTSPNPAASTTRPQLPSTTRPMPPTDHSQTTARPQPPTMSHLTTQTTTEAAATTETSHTSSPDELTSPNPAASTTRPQLPSTTRPVPPTDHSQTTARPQPPTTSKSSPTTAVPSCSKNSHYTTCIPSCVPTCSSLHGQPGCINNDTCVAGCTCDDGFVLKSRRCVPVQQCGCIDENGNKYQFNDVWYTEHCTQKCKCKKWAWPTRGMIDCDDQKGCANNAVCFPTSEGQYVCIKTGFSKCTMRKSEYKTFDSKKYDFEGEHAYLLVLTNNLPNNLPHVYVEVNNTYTFGGDSSSEENQSHMDKDDDEDIEEEEEDDDDDDDDEDDDSDEHEESRRLKVLKIKVYNHTVEFRNSRQLVLDGRSADTPVSPTAGLKIWRRRFHIYLKTDFGLKVKFNGRNSAAIKLPDTYQMKVEGLCGNFDTLSSNDMMKPDGTMAGTPQEFGESWRVTEHPQYSG